MAGVLGVHGIGNWKDQVAADVERARAVDWARHLRLSPGETPMAFCYYSDLLHLAGQGADEELEALDRALKGLPTELLAVWIEGLQDAKLLAGQGGGGAPIRQLLAWFVQRYGADQAVTERFVTRFVSEVALYMSHAPRRQAVWTRIASAIALHQPKVLIAHSLGSVACYETLWAYPTLSVDLWVTVGSPLGLPDQIFDRLQPKPVFGMGERPPGVKRWLNFADPGDPVAIPPRLSRRFQGIDPQQDDVEVRVGAFLQHKARKYLRSDALRRAVRAELGLPT